MIRLLGVLALVCACGGDAGDRGAARQLYNDGLSALEAGELDSAIEALVSARDQAGQDPELRYRAAFNLGLAYAQKAEPLEEESPEQAAEQFRRSAGWFRDAAGMRPEAEDAAVNLELVLRRLQLLADRINQGENGLEARLDRLIDDQRGLRDQVRQLLDAVEAAGAAAEPVAFQEAFEAAATAERALSTDAATISDLAAEERGLLEDTPEPERDDAARMRLVQLAQLEGHLQSARSAMAEARRALRDLRGDQAHRRADAALARLKRAREQLLDPIAVLARVAADEQRLAGHTAELQAASGDTGISLDEQDAPVAPAWLTTAHLSERQVAIEERLAEILARLRAGVDAAGTSPDAGSDPRQQHLLAAAADALPHLAAADQAMLGARGALDDARLDAALAREREALEALARAIERFAGVKQLIELTWADQRGLIDLLTPADELPEDSPLAELDTGERTRRIDEIVTSNRDRLDRLQGALVAEKTGALEQAQQGVDPTTEEGQQAIAQAGQVYDRAEELRLEAAAALARTAEILASDARWKPGEGPLPPARDTLEQLEELRRLFFTIVEHLKQLLRDQAETHDRTASAHQLLDDERPELLGPASGAQNEHAALAEALAQALEQQADQAGQAGQPGQPADPQAAEAAQRLAEAAVEVRSGSGRMFDAAAALTEALAASQQASYDLEPALEDQRQAMTHLEAAIRLLEPPQQQEQQDQQQQQQQQQQQEQQMSREEAQRRLQAIRDREAERDRERRRRQQAAPEPVEKDW